MAPVISGLNYYVTESTITATWTTDVAADSNLFAGGKPAVDNGIAANSTSHQCIVAGLSPSSVYTCFVTSGGTSSNRQNVTTNAAPVRKLVLAATLGARSTVANAPQGDTYRSFVSSDNKMYMTQDDGYGFIAGSPNSGYNTQIGVITNESTFAGTLISLSNYGAFNTLTGTDGPAGAAMTNKSTGLFGLNGNLHCFLYRQFPPSYSTWRYCNWIKSTDHGATWNNFTALSTFTANGNPVTPNSPAEPIQFYDLTIGLVTPTLYAADDGTLGYTTAGNGIDGGNAYVYCVFAKDTTYNFMLRIPRIRFDVQSTSAFEYWIGPSSPNVGDFTTDAYWSTSPSSATNIQPANAGGIWQIAFVPGINSYIMTTIITGSPGSIFKFFAAPTPAGPWTNFFTQNNPTVGQQWQLPFPVHRDLLGNVLTQNIPVRVLYNGEPGGANYKPNWSTLTLQMAPVISALTYTVTDTTIVATWTTDTAADSNLSASGKNAIDNQVAANSTSHQCIVTGLKPNTTYSCVVTSGGTSSSAQNLTTSLSPTRTAFKSASMGSTSLCAFAAPGGGDSLNNCLSSDNIAYMMMSDGFGFSGVNNAGANFQLGKITNESTFAGSNINIMSSYLGQAVTDGTDGPGGIPLRGSASGLFGINGHLHCFLSRTENSLTGADWYGNVIRDNGDHGATWNRFDMVSSFAANGQGPADGIFEYANSQYGAALPILYGADDGTLGYNTTGNQIDGANAYVYVPFKNNSASGTAIYLLRWPRISFDACSNSGIQYWIGPSVPTALDFVNDGNWSGSDSGKSAIYTSSSNQIGAYIAFVPTVNRYLLITEISAASSNVEWYFWDGVTPAGPWRRFHTESNIPAGYLAPVFFHRDLTGNVATDNIALRMIYAGDFNNATFYKAHFSTLTLKTS